MRANSLSLQPSIDELALIDDPLELIRTLSHYSPSSTATTSQASSGSASTSISVLTLPTDFYAERKYRPLSSRENRIQASWDPYSLPTKSRRKRKHPTPSEAGPLKSAPEPLVEEWAPMETQQEPPQPSSNTNNTTAKFTKLERRRLEATVETWCNARGFPIDELFDHVELPNQSAPGKNSPEFWSLAHNTLPHRSISGIQSYLLSKYSSTIRRGVWTKSDDESLLSAVEDSGQKWTVVGPRVGRLPHACKLRWRDILRYKDTTRGSWAPEELSILKTAVLDVTDGRALEHACVIRWQAVAERFEGRRSRGQCKEAWKAMEAQMRNGNTRPPRWGALQRYHLLQSLNKLQIHDSSEIRWRDLASAAKWNVWHHSNLFNRFRHLEKGIPGYENMSFRELMNELLKKFPGPPPHAVRLRRGQVQLLQKF
ncbi:hypothetical protein DL93DRAFT_829260 [Clavulina sp. PMI_390]|nr:hypothetical protein DL93DRAFT_829260 [Clavulina sp. PMI_390]